MHFSSSCINNWFQEFHSTFLSSLQKSNFILRTLIEIIANWLNVTTWCNIFSTRKFPSKSKVNIYHHPSQNFTFSICRNCCSSKSKIGKCFCLILEGLIMHWWISLNCIFKFYVTAISSKLSIVHCHSINCKLKKFKCFAAFSTAPSWSRIRHLINSFDN